MRSFTSWFLAFVVGLTLGTAGAVALGKAGADPGPRPAPPLKVTDLLPDERNTVEVYERAARSVVHITNRRWVRDWFFGTAQVRQGTGSGFVWDRAGHIVTNFHVVEGANELFVKMAGSVYRAEVVGYWASKDIAVLRIRAPRRMLHPVTLGRSRALRVGQKVLAIGNPFGYDMTLTTGVVSALGRQIRAVNNRVIDNVIQTDAAINPGNSGGPLLNSAGEVIGMTTAIFSPSGAYAGIGFAVPSDTIARVVPQLIRYGRVRTPGLGITILPDNDSFTRRYGLRGVIIARVLSGGAADRAGLRGIYEDDEGQVHFGDIIVAVGERPVATVEDLLLALDQHQVGEEVEVTVRRGVGGPLRKVKVKLQAVNRGR